VQLLLDSLKQNGKGFGTASAEQVRQVWRFADAAVIGSAIVSQIERLDNSPDLGKARRRIRAIARCTRRLAIICW
jgi:tryptophan synthase alpha subunit